MPIWGRMDGRNDDGLLRNPADGDPSEPESVEVELAPGEIDDPVAIQDRILIEAERDRMMRERLTDT